MNKKAFTLIEILLVIGLIVILAGALIVAINPGRQLARARDTKRANDVAQILNAILDNVTTNGRFVCSTTNPNDTLPTTVATITITNDDAPEGYVSLGCLIPDYTSQIPVDPLLPQDSATTGYTLIYDPNTRLHTICAPLTEVAPQTICKRN